MSLNEVDQKILRQQDKDIVYRFLQDFQQKINLFIWQTKSEADDEGQQFGIEKFQFSQGNHIFEWKTPGPLKYGEVDDGSNPMGIKRSPMMMLQTKLNQKALQQILDYLKSVELADDVKYIFNIVQKYGES